MSAAPRLELTPAWRLHTVTDTKNQLPPSEMLTAIHEQVSESHKMIRESVAQGTRMEATQALHTRRLVALNDAMGRVETKVATLDLDVISLKSDVLEIRGEQAEHNDRLVELERARYQRPVSRVSIHEAVEKISTSIVPGKTTKEDLGTELDTGSWKVRPDVLDKLLAERDAAKLAQQYTEDRQASKRLREHIVTAVAITAVLAFLGLLAGVLIRAASQEPPHAPASALPASH